MLEKGFQINLKVTKNVDEKVGEFAFNVYPKEGANVGIHLKSLTGNVNSNQGFQIFNHGLKVVIDNISCNFSYLYTGFLNKLRVEFNLIGHGVFNDSSLPVRVQNEHQLVLNSE